VIKTEQLYYLIQVAKHNSINKVAEQLYMSNAAISNAIKQMEKDCGYEILERTYRGVKLTEKGKAVVKIAEQILALHEEILDMGKEKEIVEHKYPLVTDRQTLKLLSNKIIGPGAKVLNYFDVKEVDNINETYYAQLTQDTLLLMVLPKDSREVFESDDRIKIRYLYASKMYPVSSKNTKFIKPNRIAITQEEFDRLPKIKMRSPFDTVDSNIVLSTDDPTIYLEAIKNDYGIGVMAKFAPDIYAVDYSDLKVYEPFDEEVYVVMVAQKECGKESMALLERLIKN